MSQKQLSLVEIIGSEDLYSFNLKDAVNLQILKL